MPLFLWRLPAGRGPAEPLDRDLEASEVEVAGGKGRDARLGAVCGEEGGAIRWRPAADKRREIGEPRPHRRKLPVDGGNPKSGRDEHIRSVELAVEDGAR